ncbi:hypothetical protein C461_10116 [Halorubrum aidingense JCM 13560]|uniref:Uncharacterized protein n=1 Tax=Halorubrum aidingense JCM 13560 TaxID=1230454 RepID=M0PAG7_9EURY|nr:hypothetical protein [Halorubrum aidingense]EMA66858.1 hypothetical protein C461_10116 [Halorubrum aidingense JCM 13560]
MDRRAFLADAAAAVGAVAGTGALAGCVDLGGGGDRVAIRDPPERPSDLTAESVAAYAAAREEVRTHNRHAESGAVEVAVDAVATFDHAAEPDHYATAQYAGTVYYEDGDGTRSVGELHSDPVPYLVTPDRTLRFGVTRRAVETDERRRDGEETTDPPLGVRLLNVTEESREVTVTVARRESGAETLVEDAITVEPESAVEIRAITAVRGGYRVTARMVDNGVTSEGRIEVGLPSADRGPNVDVVIDDDGISTWHLPSFEGI